MSDDLVKRLRDKLRDRKTRFKESFEAADRIEELEAENADLKAKLEKAVDALGEAIYLLDLDEEDIAKKTGLHRIVTTYAELTGDKDE